MKLITAITSLILLFSLTSHAELSKEVQEDLLKSKFKNAVVNNDYKAQLETISKLRGLIGDLGEEVIYVEANALYKTYQYEDAFEKITEYINSAGSSGRHYHEALEIYQQLEISIKKNKKNNIIHTNLEATYRELNAVAINLYELICNDFIYVGQANKYIDNETLGRYELVNAVDCDNKGNFRLVNLALYYSNKAGNSDRGHIKDQTYSERLEYKIIETQQLHFARFGGVYLFEDNNAMKQNSIQFGYPWGSYGHSVRFKTIEQVFFVSPSKNLYQAKKRKEYKSKEHSALSYPFFSYYVGKYPLNESINNAAQLESIYKKFKKLRDKYMDELGLKISATNETNEGDHVILKRLFRSAILGLDFSQANINPPKGIVGIDVDLNKIPFIGKVRR